MVASCGSGIHDGRGEFFATQIFDAQGGRMQLDGAILDIWPASVAGPAAITMRRYEQVSPAGAIGPVFEVTLPSADSVQNNDPRLGIDTSANVKAASWASIGFLSPSASGLDVWVPDSTNTRQDGCPPLAVCGPVQLGSFQKPGDASLNLPPTNLLRLAIVKVCASRADCGSNQSCVGRACQQCVSLSDCNH